MEVPIVRDILIKSSIYSTVSKAIDVDMEICGVHTERSHDCLNFLLHSYILVGSMGKVNPRHRGAG